MTVNSLAPMRTFLPIGSMFGNSDLHGVLAEHDDLAAVLDLRRDEEAAQLELDEVDGRRSSRWRRESPICVVCS